MLAHHRQGQARAIREAEEVPRPVAEHSPEILQVVRHFPLAEVPQKLVDLANERGGDDNITVIAVQVQAESTAAARPAETGEHASV